MIRRLKSRIGFNFVFMLALLFVGCANLKLNATRLVDPLPSWNDGAIKTEIFEFVDRVTTKGSPDFVSPAERIAVFDNDGTLWVEQPMYTQLAFAIDRINDLASQHPEWKTTQPFQAVLERDIEARWPL
jgi:hypothetical protein